MSVNTLTATAPFDCDAAFRDTGWRSTIGWPRSLADTERDGRAAWSNLWALIKSSEGIERDCLMLVGGRIIAQCLAIAEAASVLQASAGHAMQIDSTVPAVRYLMGAPDASEIPASLSATPFKNIADPSFVALRMALRSLMITPMRAWHKSLLAPQAWALSHNPLMHAYARESGTSVRFNHAEAIFGAARTASQSPADNHIASLTGRCVDALLLNRDLSESLRQRFSDLAAPFIRQALALAANDIEAIRKIPSLPHNAWVAGGGYYPARLTAQEILRRGGSVTGFEHGWGAGAESVAEGPAFVELGIANRYVAHTPESARLLQAGRASHIIGHSVEFLHGNGDPEAKSLLTVRASQTAGRLRVLYAPTVIAGFRQMVPPLLADPIYLDWQFRLCEAISELPVQFTCRPHPEGFFRNRPHPLAAAGFASNTPFENQIAETDIFVFDFQQSTTFGRALCTDRPIVLLNFGNQPFDPEMSATIRRRCRVLDVAFDERNRPILDRNAIRDALLTSTEEPVDPTDFRSLISGH